MDFEVRAFPITIREHPDAERLEIAQVHGYQSIVRKGQFQNGELAIYVPEGAVMPDGLLKEIGLEGKLAGSNKNRVKAIKLRGILSQGLLLKNEMAKEGLDYACEYGIEKYEPPIPVHLSGQVWNAHGRTLKYDIENIKRFPHVFQEGELVQVTEKLHGTWCCLGWHNGEYIITSKGLSAKGLAFKLNDANKDNIYVRIFEQNKGNFEKLREEFTDGSSPFYMLGEIYGKGIQDLHYGTKFPEFRVFDIYRDGKYMDAEHLQSACRFLFKAVPIIGGGQFTDEMVANWTQGDSTLLPSGIKEGIVIRPIKEREDPDLGRVILKSVSERYLLRKGGTENQ